MAPLKEQFLKKLSMGISVSAATAGEAAAGGMASVACAAGAVLNMLNDPSSATPLCLVNMFSFWKLS